MYALKRIIAYVIDYALTYIPLMFFITMYYHPTETQPVTPIHSIIAFVLGWIPLLGPLIIYGLLIGLTGRTPGKLIMFLKVTHQSGSRLGIAKGILREIIKFISFAFFFGAIWALFGIVTSERTFYDEWLNAEVEDLKPFGLTPAQKKWREYQRSLKN